MNSSTVIEYPWHLECFLDKWLVVKCFVLDELHGLWKFLLGERPVLKSFVLDEFPGLSTLSENAFVFKFVVGSLFTMTDGGLSLIDDASHMRVISAEAGPPLSTDNSSFPTTMALS